LQVLGAQIGFVPPKKIYHGGPVCYINKTETRTDFCEDNIFSNYYTVSIDVIVETRQHQKK